MISQKILFNNLKGRRTALLAASIVMAGAALIADAQTVSTRQYVFDTGGNLRPYSLFFLGETEPNQFIAGPTRPADSYGVASTPTFFKSGNLGFYAGGISSGFFDNPSGGGIAQNDALKTWQVEFDDPFFPTALNVTELVLARTGDFIGTVRALGFSGGVNSSGTFTWRMDGGAGSPRNAIGMKSFLDGDTAEYSASFDIANATKIFEDSTTLSVPSMGEDSLSAFSTFSRTFGVGSPALDPIAQFATILPSNRDNRGLVSYDSTAGILAVQRRLPTAGSEGVIRGIAVYKVVVDGATVSFTDLDGNPTIEGTVLNFPQIDGSPVVGINYFSRSAFAGTGAISISPNGDIATVATVGNFTTSEQVSNGVRKVYLFNKRTGPNTYGGWQVVTDSGAAGTGIPFTQNPLVPTRPQGTSSPAIDAYNRIWISCCERVDGDRPVHAIYVFEPDDPSAPTSWTPIKVMEEGDYYFDEAGDFYEIIAIQVKAANRDLANQNCRFQSPSSVGPNATLKFGTDFGGFYSGLMAQLFISKNGEPSRTTFVYLAQ